MFGYKKAGVIATELLLEAVMVTRQIVQILRRVVKWRTGALACRTAGRRGRLPATIFSG